MHGFVATTDQDWYQYLLSRPDLDEVNFWAPSGRAALGTIPFGAPFFFKLKHPHNAIGGFGFLGPITTIPLSLAWDAFGQKNGTPDRATMHARIRKYRGTDLGPDGRPNPDPPVGCRTILQPVFFPRDAWVPVPSDWSPNIVQGKTYDLAHGEGRRLWDACRAHDIGLVNYGLERKVRELCAIYLPAAAGQQPDRERLAWHPEVVYES